MGMNILVFDVFDALVSLCFILNIFAAIIIIFIEKKDPAPAMAWLLLLFLIPILGFFLYVFFGQNIYRKRMFNIKQEDDEKVRVLFRQHKQELKDNKELVSLALSGHDDLMRMLLDSNDSFLYAENRVKVYTDGNEKFHDLIEDLRGAKDHIHMEYYIIRNDRLANEIMTLLAQRAREGIEVMLLVDGFGTQRLPRKFFKPYVEAGGKLAKFFPSIIPYVSVKENFRNHRKIAVIDGKVGYVGGYNIGVEYLGEGELGPWRDCALRIEGNGVQGLQGRFILDWNFAAKDNLGLDPRYFRESDQPLGEPLQIVSSGPDTKYNQIKESYVKMILSAKESIYLQTPYFIPDQTVNDALRIAALSGIDVRVMIPCKPDHVFVFWASYFNLGELLDTGVKGYTYDNGFIHAKTCVVDGNVCSVGSANWDVRSFKLNFETNAIVYDQRVAKEMKDAFLKDLEVCSEVTRERFDSRGNIIRFKEAIARMFMPLL
jgi:cardiolipin synthase